MFSNKLCPYISKSYQWCGVSTTGDYELTWLAGNGNITEYELQERPQGGNEWSWKTIGSENTLQHSVSNQSAGNYQYRLRACNVNCGGLGHRLNL